MLKISYKIDFEYLMQTKNFWLRLNRVGKRSRNYMKFYFSFIRCTNLFDLVHVGTNDFLANNCVTFDYECCGHGFDSPFLRVFLKNIDIDSDEYNLSGEFSCQNF